MVALHNWEWCSCNILTCGQLNCFQTTKNKKTKTRQKTKTKQKTKQKNIVAMEIKGHLILKVGSIAIGIAYFIEEQNMSCKVFVICSNLTCGTSQEILLFWSVCTPMSANVKLQGETSKALFFCLLFYFQLLQKQEIVIVWNITPVSKLVQILIMLGNYESSSPITRACP